ncbi:hypothetical protein [Treponema sp.]|uniref:hypothetical protein n=1 Tax=Treponema sp. TaxID=166 RepID=UPI003890AA16
MKMRISELFNNQPITWGKRGDPVLWDRMQELQSENELPETEDEFMDILKLSFEKLTGHKLDEKEDFYMDAFATSGMSSGVISLDFWNKTGIPFLLEEYNRWGKNK